MPGPLDKVKVLEFSEIVAAPVGGMLLANMGADVIKVEPTWGEPTRGYAPIVPKETRLYISLNKGKRSLPLDLTKPEAREIVYKLVPEMDVVLINYRPDVPAKLGIDYETLSRINPRLVYCNNSAFGPEGPHSQRPGSDVISQSMTGMIATEGKINGGVPEQLRTSPFADVGTGITIAMGICAALYSREKTGRGQKLDASLMATGLFFQAQRFIQVEAVDKEPREEFLRDLAALSSEGKGFEEMYRRWSAIRPWPAGNIYYRTFQTKDGLLTIGCLSNPPRQKMSEILGLNDIRFQEGHDPSEAVPEEYGQELVTKAEAIFREKTTQEWVKVLDAAKVPCGPVLFLEELVDFEQVRANGYMVEVEHPLLGPVKTVGATVKMSETPLSAARSSPTLGQHTDEILSHLGYSSERIEGLRSKGVTL